MVISNSGGSGKDGNFQRQIIVVKMVNVVSSCAASKAVVETI